MGYEPREYLRFARSFVSNELFDRPKLSVLMLYATSACQSRCKTCYVWNKPVEHMPFDTVRQLLDARCVDRNTRIGFEGGEFLLHPECDEILGHTSERGFETILLSNGLMPERLERTVRRHGIPRVNISLDGPRESYERVRGLDGHAKVLDAIERIKDITRVGVMFLINPWNRLEDLAAVAHYCESAGVDLRVGVYHDMKWFETDTDASELGLDAGALELGPFEHNRDFLELFPGWRSGEVQLPCYSIRQVLVVYPNGDVPICQTKDVMLGNVRERALDDILEDPTTIALQKQYRSCNDCWIGFHRKLDLTLYRRLAFLPKPLLERLLGPYRLPDPGTPRP